MITPQALSIAFLRALALGVVTTTTVLAADQSLLDALNDEADALEDSSGVAAGRAGRTIAKDLSVEQFESTIQKRYLGSYVFYSNLDATQKREVYEEYQKTKDIALVRQKIMDLLAHN